MRWRRRSRRRSPYSKFELLVSRLLEKHGYSVFLVNAHPSPDILAIGRDRILLVEVKYRCGRVPQRQEEFLIRLARELEKHCRTRIVPAVACSRDGMVIVQDILDGSIIHIFDTYLDF